MVGFPAAPGRLLTIYYTDPIRRTWPIADQQNLGVVFDDRARENPTVAAPIEDFLTEDSA